MRELAPARAEKGGNLGTGLRRWKLEACHQPSQHLRGEMSDLFNCRKHPGLKSILSLGAVFLLFIGQRRPVITPCFNIGPLSKEPHGFYFWFNRSSSMNYYVVQSRHNHRRSVQRMGEHRKVG